MQIEANKTRKATSLPGDRHDAFNKLTLLQYRLVNGRQIDDELIEWLLTGFEALRTGSADTLDSALGVDARAGVSTIGTRLRKYYRDLGLLTLMAKIRKPGEGNWSLARRAGEELLKFQTRVWPRVRLEQKPPDRLNETQVQLWEIFSGDPNPPVSPAFLFDLLRQPHVLTMEKLINN